MRRVLLVLTLATGCASPDGFQADPTALPTADRREQELQRNLRDGLTWEEQEQRMTEAKTVFGPPSESDATGPKKPGSAR
jgi:hypothetical protein